MPDNHSDASEINQIKMNFEKEIHQNANPNQRH